MPFSYKQHLLKAIFITLKWPYSWYDHPAAKGRASISSVQNSPIAFLYWLCWFRVTCLSINSNIFISRITWFKLFRHLFKISVFSTFNNVALFRWLLCLLQCWTSPIPEPNSKGCFEPNTRWLVLSTESVHDSSLFYMLPAKGGISELGWQCIAHTAFPKSSFKITKLY